MRAAVISQIGDPLEIVDVELDVCGPSEVRITNSTAGLCHSDLAVMNGEFSTSSFPMVMGHESAGTVEAVGRDVTYVRPGDRVLTHLSSFCGACVACLTGRSHMCHHLPLGKALVARAASEKPRATRDGSPVGLFMNIGSFAEQQLVHERSVLKIGDDIPFDVAAILGCGVTTGLGAALITARVSPGSKVAVVGCGGVGLAIIQGCRLAGASQIIAVDLSDERLARADVLGATATVNVDQVDGIEAVQDLSSGGVDYSFDAAGAHGTTAQAFAMLGIFGVCTVVGVVTNKTIEIPGTLLQMERKLQGCIMGSANFRVDVPKWLELYRRGQLDLDRLVTDRIQLAHVNEGFAAMQRGEGARTVIDLTQPSSDASQNDASNTNQSGWAKL